jgi:NADH-quinone oxidoreductase subunit C
MSGHPRNDGFETDPANKLSVSSSTSVQQSSSTSVQQKKPGDFTYTKVDPANLTYIGRRAGMWGNTSGDVSGFGGLERVIEIQGKTQAPYGGWFDEVAERIDQVAPGAVQAVTVWRDEITFFVDRSMLSATMRQLRDDARLRFELCVSVSGVHYPEQTGSELHVVYHLLSISHNRRIRIETACPESDPHVPSVTDTYPMANYHERETWDMFGIVFDGHPGLTRILMPDDWIGFPQRKDYPLGGIPVEFKGAVVPPPDNRRSYAQ